MDGALTWLTIILLRRSARDVLHPATLRIQCCVDNYVLHKFRRLTSGEVNACRPEIGLDTDILNQRKTK